MRERGAFVRGVVIDVHPRKAAASFHDAVDEPFECRLLFSAISRPQALILRLTIPVGFDPAE
jgi:hypothetical protein